MSEDSKTPKQEPRARKPYIKPAVLSRESLEAVAVVCTGSGAKANPVDCPAGPLNS